MRISTKYSVAIHILVFLTLVEEQKCTSERIARSVNTNPVVIRQINTLLKNAGLITVRAGVGGAVLTRSPQDITLLDIYNAVKADPEEALFDKHNKTNKNCLIGAGICDVLNEPFQEAQIAMENSLAGHTLSEMVNKLSEKEAFQKKLHEIDRISG